MFIIKRESNEYVEEGIYCSYDVIYLFGIKLYEKVFTTTNQGVLSQFIEQENEPSEREYVDPVVVKGFKTE